MTTFESMTEAEAYVVEAIQTQHVADFDTESIAREVTDWRDGRLTLVVDDDDFWGIVSKYDMGTED